MKLHVPTKLVDNNMLRCTQAEPYTGPLFTAGASGALCLTPQAGSKPIAITLQTCIPQDASQQFQRLTGESIGAQAVTHVVSGQCLAWAGSVPHQAMVLAPCNTSDRGQQWVLGYAGVLFTTAAAASRSHVGRETALDDDMCAGVDTARDMAWSPNWQSGYPAVRDLKAAIRYVRATAATYGIDAGKIAASGGSAGATNSLAAGIIY